MNLLSFTVSTNSISGLVFDLLIDGKALPEAVGCINSGIPAYLIEGDLPAPNERPTSLSDCERIVAVCNCGEFGCDSTTARVTKAQDTVTFSVFAPSASEANSKIFVFARSNYDQILRQMTKLAS